MKCPETPNGLRNKVRLVFARTESDNVATTWTAVKTIEIELPFENAIDGGGQWQLIGAEWPNG